MDLEKEAAKYANIGKEIDPAYANGLFYGYTAGATSKYVEAEKIKAKIEVLKGLRLGINDANTVTVFEIKDKIYVLEQKLKKLEDESKTL
jgi:hypothetical protein